MAVICLTACRRSSRLSSPAPNEGVYQEQSVPETRETVSGASFEKFPSEVIYEGDQSVRRIIDTETNTVVYVVFWPAGGLSISTSPLRSDCPYVISRKLQQSLDIRPDTSSSRSDTFKIVPNSN